MLHVLSLDGATVATLDASSALSGWEIRDIVSKNLGDLASYWNVVPTGYYRRLSEHVGNGYRGQQLLVNALLPLVLAFGCFNMSPKLL